MSSNQTLVAQNEDGISQPMKETGAAVDSDPVPTNENLNTIEAGGGAVNPEETVQVEEEGKGGIFDAQLDKVGESETQTEKEENSDVKLDNDENTNKQLERDVTSGGLVGETETTEVQTGEVNERSEALGEEDVAYGNKEENEKIAAVSDNKGGENDTAEENKEENAKAIAAVEEEGVKGEETEKLSPAGVGRERGEFDPEIEHEEVRQEATVAEMREDGQTEGGENPSVVQPIVFSEEMKPKVLVSPDEAIPVPVTGTAGSDSFVGFVNST